MKKDLTELVFILDMSGSMSPLTGDTIGGFNSSLKEQANEGGEVLVTTYLFNNSSRMIHDRLPIDETVPLTEKDYRASGCTALVDAIGSAIHHIAGIHRYAREDDIPEHTLFVITTDGMENASHHYSSDEVKQMIRHEQEKYGWEFVFLAANIDAVETAAGYGIGGESAVNYMHDVRGTELVYESVNNVIRDVKKGVRVRESAFWRRSIDRDFQNRRK